MIIVDLLTVIPILIDGLSNLHEAFKGTVERITNPRTVSAFKEKVEPSVNEFDIPPATISYPNALLGHGVLESQDMDSQDQDMFFTNLLSGNSPVSLNDSPPLPPNKPSNVKRSMRGANFIPEEDKLLVSAWLNCSLDAIQGTDQKHSQFWEKIFEYFEKHKETTTKRTIKSLTHRWSCIQKATNNFCSYLAQVERLNQSGMTEHDKFERAKIMYQSLEKCNFQFEHCWHLLKDQPKWISRLTKDVPKQRKTMVRTPSPTRNVIENEVIELDRPMGRKAEKRKRKAEGMQTEEITQFRKNEIYSF